MGTMAMRNSRPALALLTGIAACAVPTSAYAQEAESYNFDLPAQDLGDALLSVAAKAGWELYAPAEDLAGVSSPQLRGNYTVKQAIERLLRGTNLVARFDDRAVIIRGRSIAATASEQQSSDAIVVTGTRIEGAPPAAPVIRISSEDIRNAGQSDLGEVARSLPQSFGGGQNPGIGNSQGAPNENANVNGASTFNLRGIGSNATLTLLNGNRFAYTGASSVMDVSSIPVAAVERIEIIPDGASAIYGADAVAGVVNILLKRDFEGVAAMARLGASTEGGNVQQQYGILGGKTWSSGNLLAAYDYSRSSAILAGDRSYAIANNPETTLVPKTWRHSILISGHQTIGPDISLAVDLLYKKSRIHSVTGYDLVLAPEAIGLENVSSSEIFGIASSLTAELGDDWRLKASGFFGTDRTGGYSDLYLGGALAIHNDKDVFNRNLALEAGVEGPLAELPAGALSVAFGAASRLWSMAPSCHNILSSQLHLFPRMCPCSSAPTSTSSPSTLARI